MKRIKLFCLLLFSATYSHTKEPENIHLSWTQNDTDNTMVVTWKTSTKGASHVEFGREKNLDNSVKAEQYFSRACGHYINTAELKGLTPDTTYFYRCGGPGSWSEIYSFRTGHNDKKPFSFISYGDTRSQIDMVAEVKDAMELYNPSFAIHTGDFVFNGNKQKLWDHWFSAMSGFLQHTPFMGTLGNHDNDADNYFDQFTFPNNEKYYSFDYGNAHFTVIYNPTRGNQIKPGTRQYSWLENDLLKASSDEKITWKFIFWHIPAYSASMYRRDKRLIKHLYPLLEKYKVDIVFSGHRHNYERTYMLNEDKIVQEGPVFSYKKDPPGIISIVSGGGGGPLTNTESDWWTAYTEKTHHFCLITVDGNNLTFKAIRPNHSILDSFTIIKSNEPVFSKRLP